MSKLEELIKEFCPNGVEYKPLEECCSILDNKRKPVTKSVREYGEYPYYGANGIQDYVSDYIFDGVFVLVGEDGSVLTSNGTPVVNWAEGKIWVNNHAHIIAEKGGILLRYLYHYLQTISIVSLVHGNIPKLTGSDFKSLRIPLPALPVQREIVRVLDSFTLYSAELTAELTARRKQYEFYRDKLLNFNQQEVEIKKLSDIFDTRNGYTPSTSNKEYWATNDIPWFRVEDIRANGRILNDSIQHVSFSAIKGKVFPANSIIISTSATIGEHALITCESIANQRFTYLMLKDQYKDKYNIKYLFYYCFLLADFCRENLQQGSFASVDMSKFNKFEFPIPPIDVQERIVKVLDNFDAICSDLGIGLPAEIEKRQKQYEYYREKLLTFDGKYATILTERNGTERNGQG